MGQGKTSAKASRGAASRLGKHGDRNHQNLETSIPRPSSSGELIADELPDGLINFVTQTDPSPKEPARKRRKINIEGAEGSNDRAGIGNIGYEYVTIRRCSWNIKCAGSKLSTLEGRLMRDNVRCSISVKPHGGEGSYVQILDDSGRHQLFITPFTAEEDLDEELRFALTFYKPRSQNLSAEGKLWTAFELELYHEHGSDYLRLIFNVRWNTTTSPYNICHGTKKQPDIPQAFSYCFPELNSTPEEKWSPQDFYQCVHTPNGDDPIAASLTTDKVETDLYPFQKRAVQWLLRREGMIWSDGQVEKLKEDSTSVLPLAFTETKDADDEPFYVSNLYGIVTRDITPFKVSENILNGGVLAEEMGLGKTLEIISLIALHKRPQEHLAMVFDPYIAEQVRPTAATLIITPPSILQQWLGEINRHAPSLNVMHYQGIKGHKKMSSRDLVNQLASSDIVLTTYSVLSSEISFTKLNPEKTLRRQSKYPRPKSPLMQLSWWRVAIDEAQMIESGVSNAAVVARIIPRINAWCITGTPIKKDVGDLRGLLIFLRKEPFASIQHVWSALITTHKKDFRQFFGEIAMRHSKQSVREELRLPPQRRYVITMPFTPIEEQHYQELFNQMCEEVGIDGDGSPLTDTWDPEKSTTIESMRKWLVRLRQTANHPEIGGKNRRALGNKEGPLRTVDQVLDAMMEQADVSMRTDQRSMLVSRLKRGQLLENSPRVKEALEIWNSAFEEITEIVQECRAQLQSEIAGSAESGKLLSSEASSGLDSDEEPEEPDPTSRIGVFRNRLRGALEIQHMATFFRANAYFQIKSNEDMTKPDSPEFEALEKLETDGYDSAKQLRQEILQEILLKANKLMKTIAKKASTQEFSQIPEFTTNPPNGGIESRRIMERLDELGVALDAQANQLDEWREQTIQFLLRPLVDEDDGLELTGDEYEISTKTQDEVMVYVQVLRAAVTDRLAALSGQENKLTEQDVKTALRLARDGEGAFPEKTLELLGVRARIKPPKDMGSVRAIVGDLRTLATSLRLETEKGSNRSQNELFIVETQLKIVQKQLSEQTKSALALEKELELFTAMSNARIEYYRQLQEVSDMVAPYEGPNNDVVLGKMLEEEDKLAHKIATLKSKRRYLLHLREEAANPQEQRICVICRETFEMGALTVCGHQYCRDCIKLWWSAHHNCPICKKKLISADLHDITYKPQELSVETEEVHTGAQERSSPSATSRKSAIYSEISKTKLAEIKNIDLDGPSFTTKVDTLARHLIWLREADPGAKSIIFSQFKDFLEILARAFERFRIGYSTIDKPNGIARFKEDAGVECFLLHARAHSSGLNLVNASHVFLCEPLLNTALELQAIARVDRIGQHQETNVWLYLIQDTVEESIHQLSVQRRMEHIGQSVLVGKGKSRATSPIELLDSNIEAANSMELQQASLTKLLAKGGKGGEMIENEDLWDCLFGGVNERKKRRVPEGHEIRHDPEVRRHLGAEAAESRRLG